MENSEEKKKSKVGIIIIIILLLLLIAFVIWFFLLRDKKESGDTTTTTTSPTTTTTVVYDKKRPEYDEKEGVLNQVVDEDGKAIAPDFVIDGIILVGNRHSYAGLEADTESIIEKLSKEGYKKTGINSSFYLNEWIEFYIDTKYSGSTSDVKILITPHKAAATLTDTPCDKLVELAEEKGTVIEYNKPESDNYKYVNNGYVSMDYPEGKYDISFVYKNKLAYFMTISMTKESE